MIRQLVSAIATSAWRVSTLGMTTGDTLSRFGMYAAIDAEPRARIAQGPVLSVSHSTALCKRLGSPGLEIVEANYPEQKINELRFPANTFSAVVSDQVFEHIECTPSEAVAEVYRVLKPGGLAIHTTCFMLPYHGSPNMDDVNNGDYWRFTPSGLARLHKGYGEVIMADGWGHPMLPLVGALGLTWMKVPVARWHPLNRLARMNRKSYASLVWVIARK